MTSGVYILPFISRGYNTQCNPGRSALLALAQAQNARKTSRGFLLCLALKDAINVRSFLPSSRLQYHGSVLSTNRLILSFCFDILDALPTWRSDS